MRRNKWPIQKAEYLTHVVQSVEHITNLKKLLYQLVSIADNRKCHIMFARIAVIIKIVR